MSAVLPVPPASLSTGYRDENAKGYLAGQDYRYWDIEFYAGIKSLKINPDFNRYLPNDKDTLGEAIFDPAFSLHPPEVQAHLEDFCDKFEALPCASDDEKELRICSKLGSEQKMVALEGTTECFIRIFYRWHEENFGGTGCCRSKG